MYFKSICFSKVKKVTYVLHEGFLKYHRLLQLSSPIQTPRTLWTLIFEVLRTSRRTLQIQWTFLLLKKVSTAIMQHFLFFCKCLNFHAKKRMKNDMFLRIFIGTIVFFSNPIFWLENNFHVITISMLSSKIPFLSAD